MQDGGSTDETLRILRSYGTSVDWRSEDDQGQSDAVNRGIRRATGEIVAWINSDDFYYSADALAKVCRVFEENPKVDIVLGDAVVVDSDAVPRQIYRTARFSRSRDLLLTSPASPLSQPATFFRKRLFEQIGGLRSDLHWALDLELWLRMFDAARGWQRIDSVLAAMTQHEDAKSTAGMGKQIAELTRVKLDYLRAKGSRWRTAMRVRWNWFQLQAYRLAIRSGLYRVAGPRPPGRSVPAFPNLGDRSGGKVD